MSIQLFGLPVSRGVAIGRAVLVASSRVDVAHYFIEPANAAAEIGRLCRARDLVAAELSRLKAELPHDAPAELPALLDVHLMLLHDPMLEDATRQWIVERHYNAEWAVSAQTEVLVRQFDEMEDEYLRDRKADVEQVAERLLAALVSGHQGLLPVTTAVSGGDPLVLVATDIAPADMLQFKRSVFSGFVTDVGGRTSHTAIVARSLDIPAVVGAREASRLVCQDDWLIIDGDQGVVVVNPSPIVLEEYRFRQQQSDLERDRLKRLRYKPAVTLDGQPIELLANIELPRDAEAALEAGAVGVGLFRSEFLFMNRNGELPDEDEQYQAYRSVVEAMKGLPVTIRTIDIGADKPLDRASGPESRHDAVLNPALGLRAIRWSLAEPDMFLKQLRAILRAAACGKVRILIPMLAQRSEIHAVREALATARQQLDAQGVAHGPVELGAMIEVPAAAISLSMLMPHFDFFSIGTNDLIQYTLAIDRADEQVAALYDGWHPAVLSLISSVIRQCNDAGKSVSVCGEMAGDPACTELLLAMGLRAFSMQPAQLPAVKQRLLRADTSRLDDLLQSLEGEDDPARAWPILLRTRVVAA
ncbi:MAG: hypothetical protein RLY78_1189 [Pseudomonadota bacterium]